MSSARNVKKVENSRRVGKARSGYNKGTIRGDLRYLVVSKDVRRHRLISIDYITTLRCDLGTRYLTATTCKACASSPSGQEQPNFGPICPPYGSIIRAWNPCGMASKNLEMNRTFALSSTPSLRWHGPPVQTAPQIL